MKPTAHRLFERAQAEGWAVGAFNAANLETIKAILGAAAKLEAPVIIESSPGETAYIGEEVLRSIVDAYEREMGVWVYLNLDHSVTVDEARAGIAAGYDLIHFDGGKLDYEENVKLTKQLVRSAHSEALLVEGEIDHITGSSDDHRSKSAATAQKLATYTDPDRARDFVKRTGIDTLAVFIGNVHGIYKGPPTLDLDRLQAIHESVDVFLSLHGGSGIASQDITTAISHGVTKINVNSELRIAFLESLQEAVKHPEEIAAYKLMTPVIEAVQTVVEKKIKMFGSGGRAKSGWVRKVIT